MAAKKYLKVGTTGIEEQAATVVSAGSGNDGDLVALDATGKLDTSVLPTGVGPATKSMNASEAITAPALINVFDAGSGVFKIRKADAATNKPAHGFILSTVASGSNVAVYFEGEITGLTGVTPGVLYLSNTTPGSFSTTIPTTSGHIYQPIGTGTSATTIDFEAANPILRA